MKNTMKLVTVGLIAVVLCGCNAYRHHEPGKKENWQTLFDGRTLTGWVQRGGAARYFVKAGTIIGETVPRTPNSFLCTEKEFSDFILELDFIVDPNLNSGIQIRSSSLPDYQNGRVHGYQVEIDPSPRAWTAGIYDEGRRGWLYNLENNPAARKAFKQNQWNHFRIEAVGDSIKTWLNGVPAADLTDSMTPRGFIALQVHSTTSEKPLRIRWRNIRILEPPPPQPGTHPPIHSFTHPLVPPAVKSSHPTPTLFSA